MTEDERTVYVGNVSERVSEELLYELFLQAGPLEKVVIPKDKEGRRKRFGFVTFKHDVSVPYTIQLLDGISMYDRNLQVSSRRNSQGSSPSGMSLGMSPPVMGGVGRYPDQMNPAMMGQGGHRQSDSSRGQFHRSNTWSGSMAQNDRRAGGSGRSPHQPSTPESSGSYNPYGLPGPPLYPSQQKDWFNQGSPMPPPKGQHGQSDDTRRQRMLQQQQRSIDAQHSHRQQQYRNPPWQPQSQGYRRY